MRNKRKIWIKIRRKKIINLIIILLIDRKENKIQKKETKNKI